MEEESAADTHGHAAATGECCLDASTSTLHSAGPRCKMVAGGDEVTVAEAAAGGTTVAAAVVTGERMYGCVTSSSDSVTERSADEALDEVFSECSFPLNNALASSELFG